MLCRLASAASSTSGSVYTCQMAQMQWLKRLKKIQTPVPLSPRGYSRGSGRGSGRVSRGRGQEYSRNIGRGHHSQDRKRERGAGGGAGASVISPTVSGRCPDLERFAAEASETHRRTARTSEPAGRPEPSHAAGAQRERCGMRAQAGSGRRTSARGNHRGDHAQLLEQPARHVVGRAALLVLRVLAPVTPDPRFAHSRVAWRQLRNLCHLAAEGKAARSAACAIVVTSCKFSQSRAPASHGAQLCAVSRGALHGSLAQRSRLCGRIRDRASAAAGLLALGVPCMRTWATALSPPGKLPQHAPGRCPAAAPT